MPGKSPPDVLKNVLNDIAKTQDLLDASIALSELLDSVDFKSEEDEDDTIEKTRSIVDQFKEKIISVHRTFYKHYPTLKKNKKVNCVQIESSNHDEAISQNSPDVINSSFEVFSDNIQNDKTNSDIIEHGRKDEELRENTNNAIKIDTTSNEKENDTGVSTGSEISQISQNGTEVDDKNKDEDDDSTLNEMRNDMEVESAEERSNTDEQSKINCESSTQGETVTVSDAIKEKTAEIDDVSIENGNEDNHDPLGMDNEPDNENSEALNSSTDLEKNKDAVEEKSNGIIKQENVFKIKCVDIKKLLDPSAGSSDANNSIVEIPVRNTFTVAPTDTANTSIVVISDSDNDTAVKKNTRKISQMMGNAITITRIPKPPKSTNVQKKKVIILDDSDSSDNARKRTRRDKISSQRRSTRQAVANDVGRRQLRVNCRKRVENLADVSSLSEISSSTSGEDELIGKNKKTKKLKLKKTSSVTDKCLLSRQEDKKLYKAYVPLPKMAAKLLKENYMKKLVKMDIRKLTNMKNLKRSRRKGSDSSDSIESSTRKKRNRRDSKKSKKTPEKDSESSISDDSMQSDPLKLDCDDLIENFNPNPKKDEADIAEILLGGIGEVNSNTEAESDPEDKGDGDKQNNDKQDKSAENKDNANEEKGKSDDKEAKSSDGEGVSNDRDGKSGDKDKKSNDKKDKTSNNKDKKDDESTNSEKESEKSEDDSDAETRKKKKKWRKDNLLTENITESDSGEDFSKFMKKKEKLNEQQCDTDEAEAPKKSKKRYTKRKGKNVLGSDSDSASAGSKSNTPSAKSSSSESEKGSGSDSERNKKKSSRRRIKRLKDSSDEEGDDKSTRKNIRKVWKRNNLADSTIAAEKEEQERKARISERQKKYNIIFEPGVLEKATVDKVVLDFDDETNEEILKVDANLVKHLKPHQANGVQFMWNTCFESIERTKNTQGSGCILAHCMGLGKTLQVITLVHTLLKNEAKTGIRKVLVVCPLSTVLNWVAEFKKWIPEGEDDEIEVFEIVSFKQNYERMYQVQEWDRIGGALIMGYDMFRNLTNPSNKRLSKKMRNTFNTSLVNPGPQLVVCDEGHLLKNEKTSTSIAMNRIQSLRRIVLTGTPLQNNLREYFCMIQFVKPNLLGTYKEYLNRFVNPITNGQYTDSTLHDIHIMRKRSHVLHKLLDGVVQRNDYAVLAPFLPPKHEYVLLVSLTELQVKLYDYYMTNKARQGSSSRGKSFIFVDFNEFQRICTHPRVLMDKSNKLKNDKNRKDFLDDESEGSLKDFIDDGDLTDKSTSGNSSGSGDNTNTKMKQRLTRATAATYITSDTENEAEPELDPSEWWRQFCTDDDLEDITHSGKLNLLFEILRQSEMIGDKVLVFSQSLFSLNTIEYFLAKVDEATQNGDSFCGFSGSWTIGLDYFRLDGSSSCDNRAAWCKVFNDRDNLRGRLFLISTRAGSLGINLVAANRVIIFDVSWNPSHDTQSIYRVYRFGQTKPSYIYRFVTLGTMEMKVYERQVTKQAISKRVIDEQQVDRHYNQNDLAELYKFEPVPEEERPIPLVPKDVLLGELLQVDKKIYRYHEHQSLLENKVDEVLDEEERKAAWEEFENEKKARSHTGTINNIPVQSIIIGLESVVRKDNPTWTGDLVVKEANELLNQVYEEVATGSSPLLQKAIVEIRLLQAVQQQNMNKYYMMMHQQALAMNRYRQQMFNQQVRPNTSVNRGPRPDYPTARMPSTSTLSQLLQNRNPVDYIDLND